ncbi:hypothetical protein scyTo_0024622, partial [Scyliorhinus torazame]|nr:hypothetical protein [Scyliorhinus torazame]
MHRVNILALHSEGTESGEGVKFLTSCAYFVDAVSQYLALIYAGLTGSITMISCTVLALTRLVFEFKDTLDMTSIEQLLQNICLLLQSKTRDVVKSALSFIKVVLFIMDTRILAQHLQAL